MYIDILLKARQWNKGAEISGNRCFPEGVGVLRLRRAMRFARGVAALRMTISPEGF